MKLPVNLSPAQQRLLHFCAVGGTAAAVHEVIVIICVEYFGLLALQGNVVGFMCAFIVSYLGHSRFTFANISASNITSHSVHRTALPRFFAVAFISFMLNQTLFAALLYWRVLPYEMALFIVLLSVATLTFVLSKFWVFKPNKLIHNNPNNPK
jgi:putative flippase GtrA